MAMDDGVAPITTDAGQHRPPAQPDEAVRWWLAEIQAAKKREQTFRDEGIRINETYAAEREQATDHTDHVDIQSATPFNILYSNTETLLPAIYSQVPRPVVRRRYKNPDETADAAATAAKKMLIFQLDTNIDGYDTFHQAAEAAVLDALLPGRGVTRVKYDAEFGQLAADASESDAQPTSYVKSELVCPDIRPWDRVVFGYAKKWSDMPWLAFEEYVTKDEARDRFGPEVAERLHYANAHETSAPDQQQDVSSTPFQSQRLMAHVYQVWDKDGGRRVLYLHDQYPDGYLKDPEPDPLGLTGFYPIPQPLQFVRKLHTLVPTAPYKLYRSQHEELNELTVRIKHVTRAIRVRGIYDGSIGNELQKLMDVDENGFVATEQAAEIALERGLENKIWMLPLEKLIQVLAQLMMAREHCKQTIYEITGISDIIRGATKASETLGAQELKSQWGTMRLKRMQGDMQRYARDLLRLMLELAATKLSEESWVRITGLPYVTQSEEAQLAVIQQQHAVAAQPLPPQIQQRLQAPRWRAVLALLKDDLHRAYQIDIETNSTIAPEAAEDKQHINELMIAIGQFLNGVAPLIERGTLDFRAAQALLLTIVRRFQFGDEIEDYITSMQPPQRDEDGAQHQAERVQAHAAQEKLQLQTHIEQLQLRITELETMKTLRDRELDLDTQQLKLQYDQSELTLRQQIAQETITMKDRTFQTRVQSEQKVQSLEGRYRKRERDSTQQAKTDVASGLARVSTMSEMVASMAQLLDTVATQLAQTQTALDTLQHQAVAPRTKTVVRGSDGKIVRVEETVTPVQEIAS